MVTLMNKKFLILSYFSAIFSLLFLCGCTSTSQVSSYSGTRIKPISYSSLDEEPFYAHNQDSFVEKKLSNGIPVIIKKSKNQNSCGVRLVIDSVPLSDPIKKAGLEDITLNMLKKGSARYSSLYISSLEYTDSTFFTSKVHVDFLEYGILTQKESLPSVIEVFASTYKFPVLSLEEFEKLTSDENRLKSDLLYQLYGILNKQNKYFAPLMFTEQSEISYKDVVDYHNGLQNGARIKIIASGNFNDEDADELIKLLEKNFASLKQFKYIKKYPGKAMLEADKRLYQVENYNNAPVCALGFSEIPEPLTDDYLSYGILSLYLDDLLYNAIREKYSMASDAGCGVLLSNGNLGLISIYDISLMKINIENVMKAVEDGLSEQIIEKKLDSYKRVYVSFIMNSEFSSDKTLDQMALGLVYKNDAKDYIKRPFRVYKISAESVRKIYEECIKDKICWIINGSMTK